MAVVKQEQEPQVQQLKKTPKIDEGEGIDYDHGFSDDDAIDFGVDDQDLAKEAVSRLFVEALEEDESLTPTEKKLQSLVTRQEDSDSDSDKKSVNFNLI